LQNKERKVQATGSKVIWIKPESLVLFLFLIKEREQVRAAVTNSFPLSGMKK
jgi:hypothetical protein